MDDSLLSPTLKDLGGGFAVRRLLPAARQRSVGPFVFFDHFGPVTVRPQDNHDVRPHPHIGLATVSYLFEGCLQHRDNLGCVQRIEPGAINVMTAGRGIVHSERRPDADRTRTHVNHGLQLWLALPEAKEEMAPAFHHTAAHDIPEVDIGPARLRVLLGTAFGCTSPAPTHSPTLYLDVELAARSRMELPMLGTEQAVYPVEGHLEVAGEPLQVGTMRVQRASRSLASGDAPARFVVIGGDPLGPRFLWWNFVSSRRERIAEAARAWAAGDAAQGMQQIEGETERIEAPPHLG